MVDVKFKYTYVDMDIGWAYYALRAACACLCILYRELLNKLESIMHTTVYIREVEKFCS